MNQFWHSSALLNYMLQVWIWIFDEKINCILICEHTIFLVILEHTQIWFSWHEKAFLYDVNEAETQEIKWDMHEVRSWVRHQTNNLVSNDLRVHGLGNVLLNHSLLVGLLHIEMLTFTNEWLWKSWCHQLFVFKKNVEKFLSKDREILFLEELWINLRKLIKFWVNLILWDGRFVSNKVLQFGDLSLILLL